MVNISQAFIIDGIDIKDWRNSYNIWLIITVISLTFRLHPKSYGRKEVAQQETVEAPYRRYNCTPGPITRCGATLRGRIKAKFWHLADRSHLIRTLVAVPVFWGT